MITERQEQRLRQWVLALVILGACLRVWGIGFGLPYAYHPDEHNLTYHALEAGANRLNPGWFEYPSLMMYLLGGVYLLYYLVLHLLGSVQSLSDFWVLYKTEPAGFTLLGRLLVAVMGTLTLGFTFRLGRWAYGRSAGLFALLFLSVSFLHVRDSHFITVDVPLTLFCTLAVLGALLGCSKGTGYLHWAAVAAGLATGTKYTGALCLLPVWMAVLLLPGQSGRAKVKQAALCTFLCLLVFLVTTPYAALDFQSFLRDIRYQVFTTEASEPIYGGGGPRWLVYLAEELRWGLGLPLELLCLAGVGYALRRRYRSDWVILAFVLPYFIFIGAWSRHWGRWILPMVPALLVLGARLWVEEGVARLGLRKRGGRILIPLATALLVLLPLYASIRSDRLLGRTDTRTLAYEYLVTHSLWTEPMFYTAFSLPDVVERPRDVRDYLEGGVKGCQECIPRYLENEMLKDRPAFRRGERHQPWFPSLGQLRSGPAQGRPEVFVISSFYRDIVYQPRVARAYPSLSSYVRFYEELEGQGKCVAVFSPSREGREAPFHVENIYAPTVYLPRLERPGPRVEIWTVKKE